MFYLREWEYCDNAQLYAWKVDERNKEHFTSTPMTDLESFQEYVEKQEKKRKENSTIERVFCSISDNSLVGQIRGFNFNSRNLSIEVGYYLPEISRGKGYGKIMLLHFINELFGDSILQLNKVYAKTSSNNTGSVKILEKCGFVFEGSSRNHYFIDSQYFDEFNYSILRKEWNLTSAST